MTREGWEDPRFCEDGIVIVVVESTLDQLNYNEEWHLVYDMATLGQKIIRRFGSLWNRCEGKNSLMKYNISLYEKSIGTKV